MPRWLGVHFDPRRWSALRGRLAGKAEPWRFLAWTVVLMIGFYAALYQPYSDDSVPGRCLVRYLELVAAGSARLLGWLGEDVTLQGTTVLGRFPFVVVLDCAALDAQALFAAAVLAFPVRIGPKLIGLAGGLVAIWLINVIRLAGLYFAGVQSYELFQVLHEEVLVLIVILCVCGLFFAWAQWARAGRDRASPLTSQARAANG